MAVLGSCFFVLLLASLGTAKVCDMSSKCQPSVKVGNQGGFGSDVRLAKIGQKGDRGARGDTGPMGVQGLAGEEGSKGDNGTDGIDGSLGENGDTGNPGMVGDVNVQGMRGDIGDTGGDGPLGSVGATGDEGGKGSLGDQGVKGGRGQPGSQGPTGIPGIKGVKGPLGVCECGVILWSIARKAAFTGYIPAGVPIPLNIIKLAVPGLIISGDKTTVTIPVKGVYFLTASALMQTYPGGFSLEVKGQVVVRGNAYRSQVSTIMTLDTGDAVKMLIDYGQRTAQCDHDCVFLSGYRLNKLT